MVQTEKKLHVDVSGCGISYIDPMARPHTRATHCQCCRHCNFFAPKLTLSSAKPVCFFDEHYVLAPTQFSVTGWSEQLCKSFATLQLCTAPTSALQKSYKPFCTPLTTSYTQHHVPHTLAAPFPSAFLLFCHSHMMPWSKFPQRVRRRIRKHNPAHMPHSVFQNTLGDTINFATVRDNNNCQQEL